MSLQKLLSNPNPDIKIVIIATVDSVSDVEYNKKGSQFQRVVITDDSCTAKAKIYKGNGNAMPQGLNGQRTQFRLSSSLFEGKVYLTGFWDAQANVNQQNPSVAQPAYNAPPPAPPEPTNKPKPKLSLESACICRQAIAKTVLESYPTLLPIDKQGLASEWADWCMSGKWTHPDVKENAAEDDIPF